MTDLERQPRTKSEYVRKDDAMRWLAARTPPTPAALVDAITAKPYEQEGKTFAKPISDVRIKGDAEFVEAIAGLLKPFLACESSKTRLGINLHKVEDRETGEKTDTWALYLKAVERGTGRRPRTLDDLPYDRQDILGQ